MQISPPAHTFEHALNYKHMLSRDHILGSSFTPPCIGLGMPTLVCAHAPTQSHYPATRLAGRLNSEQTGSHSFILSRNTDLDTLTVAGPLSFTVPHPSAPRSLPCPLRHKPTPIHSYWNNSVKNVCAQIHGRPDLCSPTFRHTRARLLTYFGASFWICTFLGMSIHEHTFLFARSFLYNSTFVMSCTCGWANFHALPFACEPIHQVDLFIVCPFRPHYLAHSICLCAHWGSTQCSSCASAAVHGLSCVKWALIHTSGFIHLGSGTCPTVLATSDSACLHLCSCGSTLLQLRL